jgi:hypothetical protein
MTLEHKVGVEVRPGVFTTNDPKYDWDNNIKRMINSGNGHPIPDDLRTFTLLEHDMAAEAGISGYIDRLIDLGAPAQHITAVDLVHQHFLQFRESNPKRMKLPNTTPRVQAKTANKKRVRKPTPNPPNEIGNTGFIPPGLVKAAEKKRPAKKKAAAKKAPTAK